MADSGFGWGWGMRDYVWFLHLLEFPVPMPDGQLDACRRARRRRRRKFVGIKIVDETVIEEWTRRISMHGRSLIAASISVIVGAN